MILRKEASIEPAQLSFSPEGIPFSEDYGDVYHTKSGGVGQSRHVFLGGNDLPLRWQGRERFVILETGFGLGLNFLVTWAAWRADPQRARQLDFISFEKHPFAAVDLARAHAALLAEAGEGGMAPQLEAELAALACELAAAWPPLAPGRHDLVFADGRVRLGLVFADATQALPRLSAPVDAFYLDGFSPARNPDLWSEPLLAELARLAAPGATLATWSVAAAVRRSLAAAGWQLAKRAGFAGKREMLYGRWPEA
ncbi:tRNA (5-methylaminomethyl-2-thiouridine)(34)-methyltransferase MnmD [Rhodocyclus purpureus]|uniref:tRNA (5-methylaminomethyl-2-thiouridine)(34)-methyltransferase MnmD n=1 Tax=Rhodocyclus purpureus TaxID=1067 RepID=UPI001913726E|nr:tRNA (5-methylaminomethyl-2-thiouridine)(34)-methyltransferase MnmD [Rhodocyclus purpureus]MBK5915116.1 hypothetical protein [Rhodocyclus purpureus]